jgi:hypothetical protein
MSQNNVRHESYRIVVAMIEEFPHFTSGFNSSGDHLISSVMQAIPSPQSLPFG